MSRAWTRHYTAVHESISAHVETLVSILVPMYIRSMPIFTLIDLTVLVK